MYRKHNQKPFGIYRAVKTRHQCISCKHFLLYLHNKSLRFVIDSGLLINKIIKKSKNKELKSQVITYHQFYLVTLPSIDMTMLIAAQNSICLAADTQYIDQTLDSYFLALINLIPSWQSDLDRNQVYCVHFALRKCPTIQISH